FQKRDNRTGESDRADAHTDKDLEQMDRFATYLDRVGAAIGRKTYQHRRQADKAVEDRDKLRHCGHLHARSDECANNKPGSKSTAQKNIVAVLYRERRRDQRYQHSNDAVKISATGGLLL